MQIKLTRAEAAKAYKHLIESYIVDTPDKSEAESLFLLMDLVPNTFETKDYNVKLGLYPDDTHYAKQSDVDKCFYSSK